MPSATVPVVRLGPEIRRRRKGLGLTLEGLAHASGLSANYLSDLENDRRDPSLSTVSAVAKALGAEPGELLGLRGLTPVAIEAGKAFQALTPEAQEEVLRLMRLLPHRRR